jgi:hypothetical protein
VNSLLFAAIGDTRPPSEGDTADYPTAIITQIYQDIQQQNAQFVVASGDFQFASPSKSDGANQLALYATARANYTLGPVFPAPGNHECTGGDTDLCDTSGNILSGGGTSKNYAAYVSTLLNPIQQPLPYYVININSTNNSWTSKFVFVACNFWDSTQASWLTSVLSASTTYTFVIQHMDANADPQGPCQTISPTSESIIAGAAVTLKITGHAHEFYWNKYVSPIEVVVGNGGASPLSQPSDQYGYALIQQQADGSLQVSQMDYNSNSPVNTYTVSP